MADRGNGEKVLLIAGASLSIICLFTFVGFPLAQLVVGKNGGQYFLRLPTILSLSLLFGFFASAISATISYGIFGLDTYPAPYFAPCLLTFGLFALDSRTGAINHVFYQHGPSHRTNPTRIRR